MRKLLGCVACLVAVALVAPFAGCGGKTTSEEKTGGKSGDAKPEPGKRLVGAWVGKPPAGEAPADASITFEFKEDGKAAMTMSPPPMPMEGTWKMLTEEGDKLTIDMELEMPKSPLAGKDEKPKTRSMKFAVEFENADRITMHPVDEPKDKLTFDRKK